MNNRFKVLYINSVYKFGSTGKLVANLASYQKYDSFVCYGRNKKNEVIANSFLFSNFFNNSIAAISTILFDNNLNQCTGSTKKLIRKIEEYNPDIIHLHNLHGYYVNIELLFNFLKEYKKPVVWTLHDCWAFTGYCPHYSVPPCEQFKEGCHKCPRKLSYPFSLFKQNLVRDYQKKKELFTSLDNLTIVTPSEWLKNEVMKSFLKDVNIEVINNGIVLPNELIETNTANKNGLSIITVANYWTEEKGIEELKKIIPLLNSNIKVTIVGELKKKDSIFSKCNLVNRTENYKELEELYFKNDIFINLSLCETFPTVNIEALAHGLPVVTYNTGGSPEMIDENTGIVIEKYDYIRFADTINRLNSCNNFSKEACFNKSKKYSLDNMNQQYYDIYRKILL